MSLAGSSLRSVIVAALAVLTTAQALADAPAVPAAQLARCAVIAAAAQRLSCYDALAASVLPARAAGASGAAAHSGAAAARSDTAAASGAAAPSDAAAAGSDASSFGLPPPQLALAQGPSSIHASLREVTANPYGDTVIQLDNGQLWKVEQSDAPLWPGESVTIRRAALGSFLMVTSDRHSYRVERLR